MATVEEERAHALAKLDAAKRSIDALAATLDGLSDELEAIRDLDDHPPRRSTVEAVYGVAWCRALEVAACAVALANEIGAERIVKLLKDLHATGPNPTDRVADLERVDPRWIRVRDFHLPSNRKD